MKRLSCYGNSLSELDVSNNSELTDLYCYLNNLTTLDISNNSELNSLWCHDNNLECIRVWDVEYAIEQENCIDNINCFIKDSEAIWSLTCSTGVNENSDVQKTLLKSIDILGRKTDKKGFKINVFNDGGVEKNYVFD